MNKHILLYCLIIAALISCGKQVTVKTIDNKQLLAQALANKNFINARELSQQVRMTENTQNIISLYLSLPEESLVILDGSIEYIKQFIPDMDIGHQPVLNEIIIWVHLKQIYQHEISPPVRILQRDKLYLAPSKIDFTLCPSEVADCASTPRKKLLLLVAPEDITIKLKKMASRDPCVNLSNTLRGPETANRCLKKSKGNLNVELLALPRFSYAEWLQFITVDI